MDTTRREFIVIGGKMLFMTAATAAALEHVMAGTPEQADTYTTTDHWWALLFDIEKCIGCGSCVRACKAENNVLNEPVLFSARGSSATTSRTREQRASDRRFPQQHIRRLPRSVRRGEGEDLLRSEDVQPLRGLAVHAGVPGRRDVHHEGRRRARRRGVLRRLPLLHPGLPYGCRYFDPRTHTADKCTLCYHRITKGLLNACVEVCPTGARQLADLKNPNDPIHEFLRTHAVQVLKPQMATGAKSTTTDSTARCGKRAQGSGFRA